MAQFAFDFSAPQATWQVPAQVQRLIDDGALFVVNHSGGKDSQAMLIRLHAIIPADQLLIVHADLPEVDWEGIQEHIERYSFGLPIHVCRAKKTFFEMVERRGMFPSPSTRQCTSDLKRDPIAKVIRHYLDSHPRFRRTIVNCMGMRAQESTSRAKLNTFKLSERNSVADRTWYEWLPIHEMTEVEVFKMIRAAGQEPHWAYKAGMTRLSCCFCIMASRDDLRTAAALKPDLAKRYMDLERRLGFTMSMPAGGKRQFLDEILAQ